VEYSRWKPRRWGVYKEQRFGLQGICAPENTQKPSGKTEKAACLNGIVSRSARF
jgi:hypothetical protein